MPHAVFTPRLLGDTSDEPLRLRLPVARPGAIPLTLAWSRIDVAGLPVWVRSAPCGAPCHCDGEYTLTDPTTPTPEN